MIPWILSLKGAKEQRDLLDIWPVWEVQAFWGNIWVHLCNLWSLWNRSILFWRVRWHILDCLTSEWTQDLCTFASISDRFMCYQYQQLSSQPILRDLQSVLHPKLAHLPIPGSRHFGDSSVGKEALDSDHFQFLISSDHCLLSLLNFVDSFLTLFCLYLLYKESLRIKILCWFNNFGYKEVFYVKLRVNKFLNC